MTVTSAHELDAAEATRLPIVARSTSTESVSEAYQRQDAFLALRATRLGQPIVAYKVAMSNAQTQALYGAGEPASGAYLAGDVVADASVVDAAALLRPVIEVEIVVRPRVDLAPAMSSSDIAGACDVALGFDISDSRYDDWFRGRHGRLSLTDFIGDNCVAGRLVLGDSFVPADELDLQDLTVTLSVDGQAVSTGHISQVEPDPIGIVQWLVGSLAERGKVLRRGNVVATGTLTPTMLVGAGRFMATAQPALGHVAVSIR